jgi:hypothetical protein
MFCAARIHVLCTVSLCTVKLPDIRKHVLFVSVFDRNCHSDQQFSLMKKAKSRIRTRFAVEHLEGCMRIPASEIKFYIEILRKRKQYQISHFVEGHY